MWTTDGITKRYVSNPDFARAWVAGGVVDMGEQSNAFATDLPTVTGYLDMVDNSPGPSPGDMERATAILGVLLVAPRRGHADDRAAVAAYTECTSSSPERRLGERQADDEVGDAMTLRGSI